MPTTLARNLTVVRNQQTEAIEAGEGFLFLCWQASDLRIKLQPVGVLLAVSPSGFFVLSTNECAVKRFRSLDKFVFKL